MRNFLVIAVLATTGHALAEDKPIIIGVNPPPSSIYQVHDAAGRPIVTIELDGSVSIAPGVTVDEAVEKTYEIADFNGACPKDWTYTYEFDFIDKNHTGIGNWVVGLQPSGNVVYVGLTPTPVADAYFHKLATLAGSGECSS